MLMYSHCYDVIADSDDTWRNNHGAAYVHILIQRCPSASLEEIERFAKLFKRRRIALGNVIM